MSGTTPPKLLFINKTARSVSLSHSQGPERLELLRTAQRTSRHRAKKVNGRIGVEKQKSSSKPASPPIVALLETLPASPTPAAIHRLQLSAQFFDTYYPESMPERTRVIDKLRQWMQPERGALALAAADSLMLLHTADTTGDETMYENAMRTHYIAIRLLRDELSKPKFLGDDEVLGTIEIMAVIEARSLNRPESGEVLDSRAHMRGLQDLILARGPSILDSDVGKSILLQRLHEFLMIALLDRKASIFGNQYWQTALRDSSRNDVGKMRQLTILGFHLPGALEKADALIESKTLEDSRYMAVLAELTTLENFFMRWLLDRYCQLPHGEPYWTTSITRSELFDHYPLALKHCFPFPVVVEYHSYIDALAHLNYWGLLLMLRKSILDVTVARKSANLSHTGENPAMKAIRKSCDEVADLFCQSACYIYSLSKNQSAIAKQGMTAFLVASIIPWYSFSQDEKKTNWCNSLLRAFQGEHTDLDMVETKKHTWTTKLYIGWVNLAF